MAYQQQAGGHPRGGAGGGTLSPAIREFLDELAEIIAEAIMEENAGPRNEAGMSTEESQTC
jgi:hypothetical protein